MVKALIIDDEISGRKVLKELLSLKHPEITLLPGVNDVSAAVEAIDKERPDLIFLDIKLGKSSGFEVLRKTSFKDYHVIFVSAHSEFALQAIKASALDYLLKPVNIQELSTAVDRFKTRQSNSSQKQMLQKMVHLMEQEQEADKKITLLTKSGYERIAIRNILYLLADHNYTRVFLNDGTEKLVTRTLGSFEGELEPDRFLRIHKSQMVNLDEISVYIPGNGGMVKMSNGTRLEVSRRRKKELLQLLNVQTGTETV